MSGETKALRKLNNTSAFGDPQSEVLPLARRIKAGRNNDLKDGSVGFFEPRGINLNWALFQHRSQLRGQPFGIRKFDLARHAESGP